MMRVYLDHNATSPLRPAARAAMTAAFDKGGNASSVHAEGRAAHALIDDAREAVAQALGVIAPMVIFTSGGSEANNLAVRAAGIERVLGSAVEHPSLKSTHTIPVDGDGLVDLDALDRMLAAGPRALVSVMFANNETGVIQPVRDVVAVAQKHGALVHTDAVQAMGKVPVNFGLLGVDMMTVSGHKFGGPLGAGALIVREGLAVEPLILGGGQELRRRAGTENVAAIAGFGAVAKEKSFYFKELRDSLESGLEPDAVVFGRNTPRLPNTSCFAQPGFSADTLLMNFDLDGIAISSGSACSSGKVAKSHVLAAMGVAPELASSAIRVSLGWNSKMGDVKRFLTIYRKILARHRARAAA